MRCFLLAIGLFLSGLCSAQIIIMSYNVENLFHPSVDSINPDLEYTPTGSRRWSYTRYYRKVEQVTRVIANSVKDGCPAIVALNEVEDIRCLEDLCRKMPHYPYRFIHFDSHDHRGIDVAFLYDSTRCRLLHANSISPIADSRDLIYAAFNVNTDTLHLIACHLPSQLSGATAIKRRDSVKSVIRHIADSLLTVSAQAKIVVCGDMNMSPQNDMPPLTNLMLSLPGGTHKYHGMWTYLDQFYVSEALTSSVKANVFGAPWLQEEDTKFLGTRPIRTFIGFRYNRNGFSDHLPILLTLFLDNL